MNTYVLGDVLVDSGTVLARRQLLSVLTDFQIKGHAITHAHFDHQGCSHDICQKFDIPLMCGKGDRKAIETGDLTLVSPNRSSYLTALSSRLAGPGHPVAHVLNEGDEAGGFTVIETPGHTPGHLAFWRETDKVLVIGDVLFNRNPVTLRNGLREPFRFATYNQDMNRKSAQKLAVLKPDIVCFGHGEPLYCSDHFTDFISQL